MVHRLRIARAVRVCHGDVCACAQQRPIVLIYTETKVLQHIPLIPALRKLFERAYRYELSYNYNLKDLQVYLHSLPTPNDNVHLQADEPRS